MNLLARMYYTTLQFSWGWGLSEETFEDLKTGKLKGFWEETLWKSCASLNFAAEFLWEKEAYYTRVCLRKFCYKRDGRPKSFFLGQLWSPTSLRVWKDSKSQTFMMKICFKFNQNGRNVDAKPNAKVQTSYKNWKIEPQSIFFLKIAQISIE